MITTELLSELRAFLPENVLTEGEPYHPLGNGGKVKVFPQSEEEIAAILKYANENNKSLNIEGGGTKRGFGGLGEAADLLLSLSKFNGVVEHITGDMTLTVKSGTNFKELEDYLARYNQKIPLDPFQPESATIGGIIAANDSGPKRLGYGSARDAVIGLRVVYPDGKVIRTGGKVVKNVAGYDMNKLFIGSMGTLGVLSEITLKLRPLPKEESLVLIHFPQGTHDDEIRTIAARILDSILEPVSLELLSPALSERLTGAYQFTIALSFEDVETSVCYQKDFIKNMVPNNKDLQNLPAKDTRTFWDKFYLKKQTPVGKTEMACLKIGIVNMDVPRIIKESHLLGETKGIEVEAHGGLGHGLCQLYLYGEGEQIISYIKSISEIVKNLGGYAVVKHLPLSLRNLVNVWGEKPAYFFLLNAIKSKVDPNRILNPKRFVGGI